MAIEREKFYECEVKRRRVRASGGYEPFWKVKNVAVALSDSDPPVVVIGEMPSVSRTPA